MRSEEERDIVKRGQKLVQNQWTFAKPGAVWVPVPCVALALWEVRSTSISFCLTLTLSGSRKLGLGPSSVAQWLGPCLPVQGTRV